MGTANQLQAVSSLTSVSVAGVDLPIADSIKVFGVTLDRRLTLDNHVSAVARSCNYHARAIRHVRHLLTVDIAQTLACSLILSRIDYCNAVLHGAPSGTIQKLQRVQNNATRVVLQALRRSHANSLLQELHWLPVEQRITYKLAVLTRHVRHLCRNISVDTSRHQVARGHCDRRQRHCCMSHSDELPSADALSALQHHLSGTLSLSPFRTVTRLHYLNLDLKHICSPPSMLLKCPVRQRL